CVPTEQLPLLKEVADGSGPGGWTVGIWMPKLDRPLAIPARARYLKPMPGGIRVGFEFTLQESSRDDLDARLQRLFNQRRAFRVRPPANQSIRVEVHRTVSGLQVMGLLRDLSLMGAGILVGTDQGASLDAGDALRIRLHLPGSGSTELAATLRYRKDLGLPAAAAEYGAPATHLGVEFSPGAVQAARATNAMGGYIVEQQMRRKRMSDEASERSGET
ncbi:MAG: PilZ domain-containing protein, partial [Myxococcota bacterium]|nr:PilZ domain-containing protein [Myxococcota bacterium]